MSDIDDPSDRDALRRRILELTAEYHRLAHAPGAFDAGASPVPVSGRVYDAADMCSLVDASLDFWLTTGRFAAQFEREFARTVGVRHALLCNSGSSANLLALSALTSPKLEGRRLRPGDEVLTVAAGFPTTVNPTVQNGLVPVFVDIELGTYNVDVNRLEDAIGPCSPTRSATRSISMPSPRSRGGTSCGWWRTAATRSDRRTAGGMWEPSAISPP